MTQKISNKMEERKYFYVKGVEDHIDLKDLFNGIYIPEKQEWRFDKKLENDVLDFLYCSSCDEEELDNDIDCKKNRLRRATSFNALDSSDEEHDSIDRSYRRHRLTPKEISKDNKIIKEFLDSSSHDDSDEEESSKELKKTRKSVSESSDEGLNDDIQRRYRSKVTNSKITK